MSRAPVLDARTLNRTLLRRQHLLELLDLPDAPIAAASSAACSSTASSAASGGTRSTGDAVRLRVEVKRRLSKRDHSCVTAEGRRLLGLLAGETAGRQVEIVFPG